MEAPIASVGILGPLDVRVGEMPVDLSGERSRRILAALVDAGAEGSDVGGLAEVIWDDRDRPLEPTAHVRTAISRLRRQLASNGVDGSSMVESRPGGYRLTDSVQVDSWEFESELAEVANAESPTERLTRLDHALEHWRGEAYAGFEDVAELAPSVTRLAELRLTAEEDRLALLVDLGQPQRAVRRAAVLAEANPWREEIRRLQALALYQSGRQNDALRALSTYAQLARSELGLEPGPELVALERAILDHDASLGRSHRAHQALRGYQLHEVLDGVVPDSRVLRRRATQETLGRQVVIETITFATEDDPGVVSDIVARLRLRSVIRHAGLEPVLDHWRDPGALHVVLPLHATRLDDELAAGPLGPPTVAQLAADLGTAIDHIHAAGIVHGEITPQSVFADDTGRRRLGGFPPVSPSSASDDVAAFARLLVTALIGSSTTRQAVISTALTSTVDAVTAARVLVDAQRPSWAGTAGDVASQFLAATGLEVRDLDDGAEESPYPGLDSFVEERAADFHGRESVVEELCERWRSSPSSRLLVLTGASGSGKSSILLAGFVPAIRRGAIDGSETWAVATMNPGSDPVGALGEALASIATNPAADPIAHLGRDPVPPGVLDSAIEESIGRGRELVLVIDQLEELFGSAPPPEADRFLELLVSSLERPGSQLRVVANLRADWLDRPLQRQPFAGLFRRAIVPLAPMTAADLERAIAQPATDRGVEMTVALRTRLVEDVLSERGALPLLGVALRELWERRSPVGSIDLDDYESIGGLSGALVGRAEELVDQLGYTGVDERRRLLGRIVAIDSHRGPVRRATRLSELLAAGVSRTTVDAAIGARLVAVDRDPHSREPTLIPTHDALLERWPRLAEWLREDRARLLEHGRLSTTARAWLDDAKDGALLLRGARLDRALELEAAGVVLTPVEAELIAASREERERLAAAEHRHARRRTRLVIAACLVSVVAVIAGGIAVLQSRRAGEAADTAEVRLLSQLANSVYEERPALGLQLALAAVARGDDANSESVLIDLLTDSTFDRQLGTAVDSQCMAMSPDPSRPRVLSFAAAGEGGRSAVTGWSVATGRAGPAGSIVLAGSTCPRISPGGTLALTRDSETLRVVDLASGDDIVTASTGPLRDVSWTVDGDGIVVLFDDGGGRVEVLDPMSLSSVVSVPLDTLFVGTVAATSPNGIAVVTSDARPPMMVDLSSGEVSELADPGERVIDATLTAAGDVVVGRSERNLMAWDRDSGRLRWTVPHGDRSTGPLAVSERGSHVATVGTDGVLMVDVETGAPIGEPLPIAGERLVLAFAGDDELTVTGAGDRIDVLSAKRDVSIVRDGVPGGIISEDGVITTYDDDTAIIIDASGSVTEASDRPTEHRPVDGDIVVGYEIEDRRFVVWDEGVRTVEVDLSERVAAGSDRGRTVRVGHGLAVQSIIERPPDLESMRLFVFEVPTGDFVGELPIPEEGLVEPVGPERLAIAKTDFTARIATLEGTTIHGFDSFGHPVEAFATASDGDLLVGLGDGSVHRFAASSYEPIQTLAGPPAAVVQILPFDGGFVTLHATGDVVKWYGGADGPAGVIHRGSGFAGFGSISRDGSSVLVPEPGRFVRVPLDRSAFVAEACRRAGTEVDRAAWRSLTGAEPSGVAEICEATGAG